MATSFPEWFPNWFGIISLQPTADVLAKRWVAVEALAKSKTRAELLGLVRVLKSTTDPAHVIEVVREADEAFQAHDCGPELRVLAGAAIREMSKEGSNEADVVALATFCASYGGTQGDDLFGIVAKLAGGYLSDEAVRVRLEERIVGAKASDFDEAIQRFKTATQGQPQVTPDHVVALVKELTTTQAGAVEQLQAAVEALREEADMFWWAFAIYSRDLGCSLRQVGLPASCLVASKELADLTRLLPGPLSAVALLDRVLSDVDSRVKDVDLADAVNGTARDWRDRWIKTYPSTDTRELTPVLVAAAKSLDTESQTDWVSAFAKSTGLVSARLPPPALAMQAYSENLLVRALAQVS